MKSLLQDFINGFNSTFKSNQNQTQAISITTDLYHGFNSSDYTIWGVFKGGSTGIDYEVYEKDDAKNPTSTIDKSNVTSLLYFYKIWLPIDSNKGVLMIQSYTNIGCVSLFKCQLENYFISKNYRIYWVKCIPDKCIQNFLTNSNLYEIQVVHSKKENSESFDPIFTPFKAAKQMSVFKNFRIPLLSILNKDNSEDMIRNEIRAIDLNYNEEDIIRLCYTDQNGNKASTKLAEIENIIPTIILDDKLKDTDTQLPKWKDLHEFTKEILEEIKIKIGYTPKDI
jgi:hypothetical protein